MNGKPFKWNGKTSKEAVKEARGCSKRKFHCCITTNMYMYLPLVMYWHVCLYVLKRRKLLQSTEMELQCFRVGGFKSIPSQHYCLWQCTSGVPCVHVGLVLHLDMQVIRSGSTTNHPERSLAWRSAVLHDHFQKQVFCMSSSFDTSFGRMLKTSSTTVNLSAY